jgi:glyoxylate utilization-related uncharacterized protein
MSLTFIDTNALPRVSTAQGDMKEVLNEKLAGAQNVNGLLRWLKDGETYDAVADDKHQLVYLMEGKANVKLEGKDYEIGKGSGVYLGPSETASITAAGGSEAKLFQLVVPKPSK